MKKLLRFLLEQVQAKTLSRADALVMFRDCLSADRGEKAVLHPLLQRNTSDFAGQRFVSTFSGEEFYLSDHVVRGHRVLPGVCYMEMARTAVRLSVGLASDANVIVVLRSIVWVRPVVISAAKEVRVDVSEEESGEISFSIYTTNSDEEGEDECVHAQGRAIVMGADSLGTQIPIDLVGLRAGCERSIEAGDCYAAFITAGIEYGAAHRGLTSVHAGRDSEGGRYVLGRVKLPLCVSETFDQYVLHPSVMDSALQASMGLMLADDAAATSRPASGAALPFALDRLEILDRTPADAWAYVRPSGGHSVNASSASGIQKLDIDISDEQGRVCVRMLGLTSRVIEGELRDSGRGTKAPELMFLTSSWEPKDLSGVSTTPDFGERWVCIDATYQDNLTELAEACPGVRWDLSAAAASNTASERFANLCEPVFARVQGILQAKPKAAVLVQVILGPEPTQAELASALAGLFKSATQENPKFVGQVIALSHPVTVSELLQLIDKNTGRDAGDEVVIRYVGGIREISRPKPLGLRAVGAGHALPWKEGGVYLITGGAGGLGLIFAREIAKQARSSRIILVGRSALSDEKRKRLADLQPGSADQARIEYRQVDVTDAESTQQCIADIVDRYGKLNGIIHSAGVVHDNFIVKKSVEEFRAVVNPKVAGVINLDRAAQDVALDLFIFASSVSSVFGNTGQCDYAAANAYMDAYAKRRNELVAKGLRHGKTVSINWPLWAEGGMRVDSASVERMTRQGFDVLTTIDGIDALYRVLASDESQVIVLFGAPRPMRSKITAKSEESSAQRHSSRDNEGLTVALQVAGGEVPVGAVDKARLLEKVQHAVITLMSKQLKVKADDIDVETELSEFGFDSIALTAFSNALNHAYGLELSPTIFFEYPTVQRFTEYLVQEHTALLAEKLAVRTVGAAVGKRVAVLPSSLPTEPIGGGKRTRRRRLVAAVDPVAKATSLETIAIVGMSGCFPGARDVDTFWENLQEGRDCIAEIPKSRWDWQTFYGDPAHEANKTNIKWGGFIEGVDEFDPLFFSISPREAESMDPQQRLLMTYSWGAIEDAGYSPTSLSGSQTGVFVGTANSDYGRLIAEANVAIEGHSSTGAVSSIGPNRVSYLLNLHGPSEPIETACSSSLVAMHRAVRAMQSGDCEMALVGGINTIISPWGHISFNKAGMLCEDGRCKTFSKDANGYVRGEGVGMLFLKKLPQAERDGDHIYGVIRGSAENHGGRANSLTAPNPKAQAELLKAAYREAQIDPRSVTYIETHGTGTPLGDPIEINGLKSAFADLYAEYGGHEVTEAHCGLGSVKTNVGHLELAAGVAGVIKVLLQLRHQTLVKSLHCAEINPYIQLQDSPFYVVNEKRPWVASKDSSGRDLPRRAGISSFGFGGVNAHVVIEEYTSSRIAAGPAQIPTEEHPALIVLSAKNEERLREYAHQLLKHIQVHSYADTDLSNIAYTLQVGREAMECRLAFTAVTIKQLQEKLLGYTEGKAKKGEVEDCYYGEVRKNKDALSSFNVDEDMPALITTWLEKRKYTKLLELWVKGLSFHWATLYRDGQPKRLRLPTYPFSKESYWISSRRVRPSESVVNVLEAPPRTISLTQSAQEAVPVNFADKPRGIALQTLSNAPIAPVVSLQRSNELSSLRPSISAAADTLSKPPVWPAPTQQIRLSVEALETELTASLAEALFTERADIDGERPFVELGLDSIVGVEWMRTINRTYGLTIPTTKLYDYPNIKALAGLLHEMQSESNGVLVQAADPPVPSLSLTQVLQGLTQGAVTVQDAEAMLVELGYIEDDTEPSVAAMYGAASD